MSTPSSELDAAGISGQVDLIPRPAAIKARPGKFRLGRHTTICIPPGDPELAAIAGYLAARLRPATGFPLAVVEMAAPPRGSILLTLSGAGR